MVAERSVGVNNPSIPAALMVAETLREGGITVPEPERGKHGTLAQFTTGVYSGKNESVRTSRTSANQRELPHTSRTSANQRESARVSPNTHSTVHGPRSTRSTVLSVSRGILDTCAEISLNTPSLDTRGAVEYIHTGGGGPRLME